MKKLLWLQACTINVIIDEEGDALTSHNDVCSRWQCYLLNVLNVTGIM